jgi:hypothetical protein
MAPRSEAERDFELKAAIRAILWAQGYSTRPDVLLAYPVDTRTRHRSGKAGLTDLDVLGIKLDAGFNVKMTIADCKTSADRVPERLFWLAGVAKFFGVEKPWLVRSKPLPEHAPTLARSLGITLVGPEDLVILTNTFVNPLEQELLPSWKEFLSGSLLSESIERISRSLPNSLQQVDIFRETLFWMNGPSIGMQRIVWALQQLAKDGARGQHYKLVFADLVWLFVISLWKACEAVMNDGLSHTKENLELFISGNEEGVQQIRRMQRHFESMMNRLGVDVPSLSTVPPYFENLYEVVVRCVRRPEASARMARRAEWLVIGEIIGGLGPPPWKPDRNDAIASKLLGDVAFFLCRSARLDEAFLIFYLELLSSSTYLPDHESEILKEADSREMSRQNDTSTTNTLEPGTRETNQS